MSVGEVNRSRAWRKDIPANLVLAANPAWGSDIIDTRKSEWHTFLIDHVFEPLWGKGFSAFFLDTLDSYERTTADSAERDAHAQGIAAIVTALKARHPDAKVLFNRGFDILPKLQTPIDGVVAESLYRTSDASGLRYTEVDPAQTVALEQRLTEARTRYNLPVTVIDYVPPTQMEARRETARRILRAGFDPWVTVPQLDEVGVGSVEIVPRHISLLYKSNATSTVLHDAVVLIAPVLEYLGYAVDYLDVRLPLPQDDLVGQSAGVVVLIPEGSDDEGATRRWIVTQMDRGIRVAFLEGFGFEADTAFLSRLGLTNAPVAAVAPMALTLSPYFGFEAPARPHLRERSPIVLKDAAIKSLLRVTDAANHSWDGAVLGPWGGAVFSPYMIEEGIEEVRRWILDPFKFLKDALALPAIPTPDVTTESGRRILTVHIDGDAFVSRAERRGGPYCGQVVLDEVLKKYPIPHTVSIIEGEIGPTGLYPQDSPKLEAIARQIFALPNVEIGTHLYSHPFDWHDAEAGLRGPPLPFLRVPNYTFDLNREIKGSTDYINTRLAPAGKKVAVVQWTGDCLPSSTAVAAATTLGLLNINGGGATRTVDVPTFTHASAMGLTHAPGVYQVFAPVENENVYTNDWHGPFYGYRRAIETFELNDRPRRTSTITLYYHFYSAAKLAALTALHEVYAWAMKQETTPLFVSDYAVKVLSFQRATLAKRVDGSAWEIGNYGDLHTVRLDGPLGWPDMNTSKSVAGVHDLAQGRYVHLAPNGLAVIGLSTSAPARPYLESANGSVVSWKSTEHGASMRIAGRVPLSIVIGGAPATGGCTLVTAQGTLFGMRNGATIVFQSVIVDTGDATLECR